MTVTMPETFLDVTSATPAVRRAMGDVRKRTMRKARHARIAVKESFLRNA